MSSAYGRLGGMDGLNRNIRYLLWKEGAERKEWPSQLSKWLGCPLPRAEELLEGEGGELTTTEKRALATITGLPLDEFSADLLGRQGVNILVENIRHLINGLPHGQKKEIAASLGVDVTTVSRWLGGSQRPTKKKLEEISKYFGLPRRTELESVPIFLSTEPIGENQMRDWLTQRLQQVDGKTLREVFPALKRLLGK